MIPIPTINTIIAEQPEFVRPVWAYLDNAVSQRRINDAKLLLNQNAALLADIETRTGVPREILVAIWGMESAFGTQRGNQNMLSSIATLAYDCRRPDFFHKELVGALQIKIDAIATQLQSIPMSTPLRFTTDADESAALWKVRKGMFPAIGAMRPTGTTVIIEDVAFPVASLAAATLDLQRLMAKHGYSEGIIFGHALEGNLHFVFTQDFSDQAEIDRLFAADTLEVIRDALAADSSEFAQKQSQILATKSPLTCKVSLEQLRRGAAMTDFADEMRMEYAVGSRIIAYPDFVEGVRAVIVDKDNAPRWNPACAEDISDTTIETIFAPLPASEQWSPL